MIKSATAAFAAGAILTGGISAGRAIAQPVSYRTVTVQGLDIFYREAGPATAPIVLLLHGFPTSSHMFRDLIPILATKYHVVAPDYPGFGQSSAPPVENFAYTFGNLAGVVDDFTQALGLKRYVLTVQDYGGPIGMRLAIAHPERVRGLIVQNAVVNAEGWHPEIVAKLAPVWTDRNAETEKPLRGFLTAETTEFQYRHGASRAERVSPDAWTHDQALLDRPGNAAIQVELLYQYKDNVARYPEWQAWLKARKPPTLVVWGNNDPFFAPKGRDLFKALNPTTEVHSYDAGHFALETHAPEIGSAMLRFLDRLPPK